MKLKNLLAVALMAIGGSAWAQTDVTSTYLVNPSFEYKAEGTASTAAALTNNGTYYGWQLPNLGTQFVNISIGDASNCNGQAFGIPTAKDGSFYFYNRRGWNSSSSASATLSTNSKVALPAGKYTLSIAYKGVEKYNSGNSSQKSYGSTLTLRVSNSSKDLGSQQSSAIAALNNQDNASKMKNDAWKELSLNFTVESEESVTFNIDEKLIGGVRSDVVIDDVKLIFDYSDLTNAISSAKVTLTHYPANSVAYNTLNTAIANAEALVAKDGGLLPADMSSITAQITALETALTNAQEAYWNNASNIANLSNLNFASGDAVDNIICTYVKDMGTNKTTYSQMQPVSGWGFGVDNDDARAAGIVAYGTENVYIGSKDANGAIPASGPDDSNGRGLGMVGVWSGTVQYVQPVILPAGTYTISYYICNTRNKNSINKNLCGFIAQDGTEYLSTTTTYAQNTWVREDVEITLIEETKGNLSVGFTANGVGSADATRLFVDRIVIKSALDLAKEDFAAQQTIAQGYLDNNEYAGVTGTERTDLQTKAADLAGDVTIEQAKSATEDLKTAITTFNGAKDTYAKYDAQTANAKAIGVTDEALNNARPESKDDIHNALNRIIVLEDQAATAGYTMDATNIFGTWIQQNTGSISGQHWSGDNRSYIDKSNNKDGFTMSVTNNVTLPAGKYVFKAAARMAKGYNNYGFRMSAKIGDNTIEQNFVDKGSEGYGIDKTGAANYTEADDTYCNDNKGRGWEWRFIGFELQEETEVTMSVYAQVLKNGWVSFTDITLLTTDDNETILAQLVDKAKEELQGVIDAAPSETANVGTGAFQIPAAAATTYTAAKTAVQAAHDAQDATLASLADAKSTFETAINTFMSSELNQPADGKKFTFTLTKTENNWAYNGKAITYLAGDRNDHGGYNIKYQNVANANYAQAFTMTHVEGNKYKMSQTDADGNERYICTVTGGGYDNNNNAGIRTTTEANDALVVEVIPTAEDGIYNLKNTAANALIGSQDAGVYTVNRNNNFTIAEATKASANFVITAAKYGTFIAPFNADKPDGVTLYTCASVENDILALEEAGAIVANTPYIVYAESEVTETLEDWGLANQNSYTAGLLTGTYSQIAAPNGSYILQNQSGKVGFYQVDTEFATPNVGANRAYLTAPSASPAKVRGYFFDAETAISAIEALTSGKAEIYNLNGVKLNSLQKGVNIVNGKKIMVK